MSDTTNNGKGSPGSVSSEAKQPPISPSAEKSLVSSSSIVKRKQAADSPISNDKTSDDANSIHDDTEPLVPKASEDILERRKVGKAAKMSKENNESGAQEKKDNGTDEKSSSSSGPIFGAVASFSGFGAVNFESAAGFRNIGSGFGGFGSGNGSAFGIADKTSRKEMEAGGSAEASGDDNSSQKTEDDGETSRSQQPHKDHSVLPSAYKPESGEENEIVLAECRCKTHRWGPASFTGFDNTGATTESVSNAALPCVESSLLPKTLSMDFAGNQNTEEQHAESKSSEENVEKHKCNNGSNVDSMVWREVGVGPLRVLQSKKEKLVRLVQRRQVQTSSAATKVLLNFRLFKESTVSKPGERHVKLTTPTEDGKAATFLFKLGKITEADELASLLSQEIPKAASCFGKQADSIDELTT